MTDYTITTNFGAKDSLPSGNAGKVIKGEEFTTEFTNIQTAVNTKADTAGDTFTGVVNFSADVAVNTNTLFVDVSEAKVGIGTTSPDVALDIERTNATDNSNVPTLRFTDNDTSSLEGQKSGQIEFFSNDNNPDSAGVHSFINGQTENNSGYGALVFGTGQTGSSAERMRIDSSGNVGIGTSSPAKKLHVLGGDVRIESTFPRLYLTDTNNNSDYSIINNNGQFGIYDDTNATYRMVINNTTGKVGIGTDSPDRPLDITDDANDGTGGLVIHSYLPTLELDDISGSGTSFILQHDATNTLFKHDTTERMRIDSSGNLLVGTASYQGSGGSGAKGTYIGESGLFSATRSDGTVAVFNRTTSNGTAVELRKNGTTVGSISVTSSATSYNTSSDERLKENITDSADAGSKVDAIQIRQFDWIADGSHQDYGVIAQELVEVAPEAVSEGDTEEDMMGVDYSKLVPMLIKEVQSLRSRVAELENV